MKKRLVMKFGGTSVANVERIKNAAKIVQRALSEQVDVIVVVSAMGHTTDELLALSHEASASPQKRELDALMATGEQVSAALMAIALTEIGCPSRSLSGTQARLVTDEQFGDARFVSIDTNALTKSLAAGVTPVVTGFQGVTAHGEITTLGRGGSDTTAIALAAAMHAERCDIYSDVNGVYTADPRLIKEAVKLDTVAAADMLELAQSGAQVLNAHSVELAMHSHIPVRVRSTFSPDDEGTLVSTEHSTSADFAGLAISKECNCIEIRLKKLEFGLDRKINLFPSLRAATNHEIVELLALAGIASEVVTPVHANPFKILLALDKSATERAAALLRQTIDLVDTLIVHDELQALTLVGVELTAAFKQKVLQLAGSNDCQITGYLTSGRRLTVLLPQAGILETARHLHQSLFKLKAAA